MKKTSLSILSLIFLLANIHARIWTNQSNRSVEGEIVETDEKLATIQRASDSRKTAIPTLSLSEGNQSSSKESGEKDEAKGISEETLKIVIFSVQSADSTLIIFPNKKTMMIDSATDEKFASVVLPFLKRHGITHLDYYAETHRHRDHIGGRALLEKNRIHQFEYDPVD